MDIELFFLRLVNVGSDGGDEVSLLEFVGAVVCEVRESSETREVVYGPMNGNKCHKSEQANTKRSIVE